MPKKHLYIKNKISSILEVKLSVDLINVHSYSHKEDF